MKIHLCCGDVYLVGYENCDVVGRVLSPVSKPNPTAFAPQVPDEDSTEDNPNETTLEHYFKFPFEQNVENRFRREFILDRKMDLLGDWPWMANEVDEIVMVNAFEHFTKDQVSHILTEALWVLKKGGIFKFDFPDLKRIVEIYHETDPEFMMNLIYCNHKNKYSVHEWGYTIKSIRNYLSPEDWQLVFKDVVQHDYPSTGVWAYKK